jgi:MFS family permease
MKKETKQIFLVFLAYYFITCFSDVYMVFVPFFEKRGASPRIAGLFISCFYIVRMLSRPLGSWTIEKLGMRKTLVVSASMSIFTSIGIVLSLSNYPLVIFFRSISGISDSIFVCATVAYQSMVLDYKSRGFGFALFTTGSTLPMATIVPLSEWLINMQMTTAYIILPVVITAICLGTSFMIDDIPSSVKNDKEWGRYSDMFRVRGVKIFYLSCIILLTADGTMMVFSSLAQERHVSVSYFMISLSLAALIIRTLGYKFINRAPRLLLAGPTGALIGLSIFCVSFASSPQMWIFWGIVYGVGIGIGYPVHLSIVGDLLPIKFHPKATGTVLFCVDLGWGIIPLIYGIVSPAIGASWTFRLIGFSALVCMTAIHFMLWLPLWKEKRSAV